MTDTSKFTSHDLSEARNGILHTHESLTRVADYCEQNYKQADESNRLNALNETKNYTNESLASVAYQINTLAKTFLQRLEYFSQHMDTVQSDVESLYRHVEIKKAKSVRRHFKVAVKGTDGADMTSAPASPSPDSNVDREGTGKIVRPAKIESVKRYVRKAIDYSALDGVGLGVIITEKEVRQPALSHKKSSIGNAPSEQHAHALYVAPPTIPKMSHSEVSNESRESSEDMPPLELPPPPFLQVDFKTRTPSWLRDVDEDLPPLPDFPNITSNEFTDSLPPPPPECSDQRDSHLIPPPPPLFTANEGSLDSLSIPPPPPLIAANEGSLDSLAIPPPPPLIAVNEGSLDSLPIPPPPPLFNANEGSLDSFPIPPPQSLFTAIVVSDSFSKPPPPPPLPPLSAS